MATFDDFWKLLKEDLAKFAQDQWQNYRDAATKDGDAFLEKAKADLQRWSDMLEQKKLTPDDFKWLVVGKKDLAELVALKQKGLAKAALDSFVNGMIDTVVSTAFKVFS